MVFVEHEVPKAIIFFETQTADGKNRGCGTCTPYSSAMTNQFQHLVAEINHDVIRDSGLLVLNMNTQTWPPILRPLDYGAWTGSAA